METLVVVITLFQSMAISLGVGSSTLAIVNFFVALADGAIDQTERRLMGVVYTTLRIAMVIILITTSLLFMYDYSGVVSINELSTYYIFFTLIAVLFANATLMTLKVMPPSIGPALQASTWYTLGIYSTLALLALYTISYTTFLLGYFCIFLLTVVIVNALMAHQSAVRKA